MPRYTNQGVRPTNKRELKPSDAKIKVLELIAGGMNREQAMAQVGRTLSTYLFWRKTDEEFSAKIDSIRASQASVRETGRPQVPDFPEFCEELGQPLHPHQLQMWDIIEGRQPRSLHPSMTYRPGQTNRVLINVPPDHAKSTTFTVNYSVWKIHKNPDIRIVIMSQTRQMAEDFLGEIKLKLTSPIYRDMHIKYAPEGGWKDPDNSWTNSRIFVKGKNENGIQKDPTVQAIGLSGHIYGRRADIIWLDDIITTKNSREIDHQQIILDREIESRLPPDQDGGGLLGIIGTRVSPQDLYRTLIDVTDHDDEPVWSFLRMPAVLDYGQGTSDTWTTLWPWKWNGKSLGKKKRNQAAWNLIYQQLNVDDEMTFKAEAVDASINGLRFPGPLKKDTFREPVTGMDGLYVVGGLDPASTGFTAMIVAALDREKEKRYVIDGFNKADCLPELMTDKIKYFTELYHINEWVIEKNAYQRAITQDRDLINYLRAQGCKLTGHYTTANKYDEDFGIATMGPLFDSCGVEDPSAPSGKWRRTPNTALIELPSPRQNDWVATFVQQLTTWQPSGLAQKHKTDMVMALWFCEIAFKRLLNRSAKKQHYRDSPFMTVAAHKSRKVISLSEIKRQRLEAGLGLEEAG